MAEEVKEKKPRKPRRKAGFDIAVKLMACFDGLPENVKKALQEEANDGHRPIGYQMELVLVNWAKYRVERAENAAIINQTATKDEEPDIA